MEKATLKDTLNLANTGYADTTNIMIKLNTSTVIADNTEDKGGEYNGQDITWFRNIITSNR